MNAQARPGLRFWPDTEVLECVAALPEAPKVMTFCIQAPSAALFGHDPGQFIRLELLVPGGAMADLQDLVLAILATSLTITVKAQPGSVGACWMVDHLRPGRRLALPAGFPPAIIRRKNPCSPATTSLMAISLACCSHPLGAMAGNV